MGNAMEDIEISAESWSLEEAIANLRSDDASLRYYAAWWVGRFRVDLPEVIEALIEGLSFTEDATEDGAFPLQRNAARALGKLDDRQAVMPLIEVLESSDFYVREAAVQSLGALGDSAAIPPLRKFLQGGIDAAVQAEGKPHLLEPYDSVLRALGELGAAEAICDIQPFMKHPLPKLTYAAVRAMYQLTQKEEFGERLVMALNGPDVRLRRIVLSDIGACGYVAGAEAVARARVESNLRLYALRDLLAHPKVQGDREEELTAAQVQIMDLMDGLL